MVVLVILLNSGTDETEDPVSAYEIVVDRLMERTAGMTNGVEYLAIDTTQITNLNADEKFNLLRRMQKYNLIVIESTRSDLEANGMIHNLYSPKGLLIIIETHRANRNTMTMDAQIWRGGAAGFGIKGLKLANVDGQWQWFDSSGVFIA
jgi:hypothetical protein